MKLILVNKTGALIDQALIDVLKANNDGFVSINHEFARYEHYVHVNWLN